MRLLVSALVLFVISTKISWRLTRKRRKRRRSADLVGHGFVQFQTFITDGSCCRLMLGNAVSIHLCVLVVGGVVSV